MRVRSSPNKQEELIERGQRSPDGPRSDLFLKKSKAIGMVKHRKANIDGSFDLVTVCFSTAVL